MPTKRPRSAPTRVPRDIEFTYEALPPLAILEREWRTLEVLARPSFFTSWQWVGTLLATVPPMYQPKAAARSGAGRDDRVGVARKRRHPPSAWAGPVARSLPQRDGSFGLQFDHDRAQRHPCTAGPGDGGLRCGARVVRRSRRQVGRALYQRFRAAFVRSRSGGPRAEPDRDHPPLLFPRSRFVVVERR